MSTSEIGPMLRTIMSTSTVAGGPEKNIRLETNFKFYWSEYSNPFTFVIKVVR